MLCVKCSQESERNKPLCIRCFKKKVSEREEKKQKARLKMYEVCLL